MGSNFINVSRGYFRVLVAAFCAASGMADERILTMQQIEEAREEIIQEAVDHAYVEASRSEGDYDVAIDKIGEQKIRKILERLL